ncbi:hypothetical protein [Thalassoroseus pseudoceratinae]|nr:hypothetical protein [Thalassoroseus pseudoceratinae]
MTLLRHDVIASRGRIVQNANRSAKVVFWMTQSSFLVIRNPPNVTAYS